jgi:hypothetical protein
MSMSEMKSKVMMVDPALALAWLQRNIETNRPLRPTVVENYADEMRRGEWHLTHQGIALDIDGNLIDGQHRLAAVIKANVIVPMMVTVNAPRASFVALDGGVKRTLADRLTMPPDVVTVLNAAWCLKKNSTQRTTPATVAALASTEFGAATKRLFETSPLTRRRVMSSSSVSLAAVVNIVEGQDFDWVVEQRRVLISQDEANETPMAKSFRRRFQDRRIGGDIFTAIDVLACALRVFDASCAHLTGVKLYEGWESTARSRVINALNKESN